MPDITPKQLATLARILRASGVWRHFVYVGQPQPCRQHISALLAAGLIERRYRDRHTHIPRYRPTVRGCEVARGRETEACIGSETGVQCT